MLTGRYHNSIDEKGRACIPVKFRYSLGERVWLVTGVDGCLEIYTQESWKKYLDTYIINRTREDEAGRQLQRMMLGGSDELEIDSRGRINLPADMLSHAKIKENVIFVGVGDFIELWSEEVFKAETGPDKVNPKEIMANAAKLAAAWE